MMGNIIARLLEFLEDETRSCSMNFGCVTREWSSYLENKQKTVYLF